MSQNETDEILKKIYILLENVLHYLGDSTTYEFVDSVRKYVKENNKVSVKQLRALNNVNNRIKIIKKSRVEKLLKKAFSKPETNELQTNEYIPF